MKNLIMTLLATSSIFIASSVSASSGYSTQIGNHTFHNIGGVTGTSTQIGNHTFHNFNN